MRIAKKLYIGQKIAKRKRAVLRNLRAGKLQLGVYVICLAASEKDLLDLIPSYMLFRYEDPMILGLAASKQEAMEVCGEIVADVYARTGSYEVKRFFGE